MSFRRGLLIASTLTHLLTFAACSDDKAAKGSSDGGGPGMDGSVAETDGDVPEGSKKVSGSVLDAQSGAAINEANLSTQSGITAKSGSDGSFELVAPRGDLDVGVTRESFAATLRSLPRASGSLNVYLKSVDDKIRFRGDEGVTAKLPSGVSLEIPKDAVVDADGKKVPDLVTLELSAVDGNKANEAAALPGDGVAAQKNDTKGRVSIVTGLSIRIYDEKDTDLSVDKDAAVVAEVPAGKDADPQIGVYSYDESKAQGWKEEGKASLSSNAEGKQVYRADIEHLSWWAFGRFYDTLSCVRACVEDGDGKAVPGAQVWVVGSSIAGVSTFFTDATGCGAGDTVADADVVLVAQEGKRISKTKTVRVGNDKASAADDPQACQDGGQLVLGSATTTTCALCDVSVAPGDDASVPDDAGVNVGGLAQQAYLKASNVGANDFFGSVVAVSGDTLVVGARNERSSATGVDGNQNDDSSSNNGAAYVFVRTGSTWTQQAYLKASNSEQGDTFGTSVAISGDTIVVGAPDEDSNATTVDGNQADNTARASGAAYVFVRSGSTWTQQSYLKASNTEAGDQFGRSVAISGDSIVVGANGEDSNGTGGETDNTQLGSGAAYAFTRSGSVWSQQAYLKANNAQAGDAFGRSVGISGNTLVVGANLEDGSAINVNGAPDEAATDSGAAYVFERSGSVWTQQAYLKASNTGAQDDFADTVAIWGDTIVVGAVSEDSAETQINGPGIADESAQSCGAAYVYQRSGNTWVFTTYLKASNGQENHDFGSSVSIDGDLIVVGAFQDDSIATTVNGDQTNSVDALSVGAAFVYARAGTTWAQQSYLKASNSEDGDWFGSSVSVSGQTFVVGAYREDSSTGMMTDNGALESGAVYVFR